MAVFTTIRFGDQQCFTRIENDTVLKCFQRNRVFPSLFFPITGTSDRLGRFCESRISELYLRCAVQINMTREHFFDRTKGAFCKRGVYMVDEGVPVD